MQVGDIYEPTEAALRTLLHSRCRGGRVRITKVCEHSVYYEWEDHRFSGAHRVFNDFLTRFQLVSRTPPESFNLIIDGSFTDIDQAIQAAEKAALSIGMNIKIQSAQAQ